ncbi:hypothetical protein AOR_1_830084 [Paecilomyces variotii No. 5]|uniref:BZIP domain-containing protein n=1 Tax=Byssochlamys spectabilis (strain No. 5 / NBRC 109023) TaxID=1356009 RepID=V5HTT1_BYSSN|nr:hypothetical protein AOR_1_830084 [Paecilomyces variotii No. 5]
MSATTARRSSADTPDATRTQVRRKQIREAQRAYRSRQQSLVTDLKSRVSQLENTLDEIRRMVDSFHGQIIQPETSPPQPQLMKTVTLLSQEISTELKNSEHRYEESEQRCFSTRAARRSQEFDKKLKGLLLEPSQSLPLGHEPPSLSMLSTSNSSAPDFWRFFFQSGNALLPPITTDGNSSDPWPRLTSPGHHIAAVDRTIEYTTSPFTRRLFHACARAGHQYLTNSLVTDEEMWQEFGLVLQRIPRQEITTYFQRVLRANPCTPVEDPKFPFISLGGAGNHFLPTAERAQNLHRFQSTNGVRVLASLDDWFDVNDVERYLISSGIRLVDDHSLNSLENSLGSATTVNTGDLIVSDQAITNMTMRVDEKPIIKGLSRLCICLGCVAGFRRRDVENLVWQNVKWV